MKKKVNTIVYIIISILILLALFLVIKKVLPTKKKEAKKIDTIDLYNYRLLNTASDLYKSKFKELKNILKEKVVDEEKYAQKISELFVIDFYDLKNKMTNKDLGGLDFIHPDILDNFKNQAYDTYYKYLNNSVINSEPNDLPEVIKTTIVKAENKMVEVGTFNDSEGYIVDISWTYNKDKGYQTKAKLYIIHKEHKLYIIKISQ